MANTLIIVTALISMLVTLLIIPFWIMRARKVGLVGKDVHKKNKSIPELGGLSVLCGFLIGVLFYVAVDVFFNQSTGLIELFAALTSILIAAMIGFVDDILGWKIGLRQYQKVLLTFFIALPLMVVNAGESIIFVPFLGQVDVGLLYPLILIPLGVMGTSNGFNMIAGYNGLEAGMGIIILFFLSYFCWLTGSVNAIILGVCMMAALVAFLFYNFYPAKIFPGDTLTYPVGALIAVVAILGNVEKFALFLFVLYFFEFVLKARGMMQKESFSKVLPDGSLDVLYKKFYGLEHCVVAFIKKIKGKCYETDVVLVFYLLQIIVGVVVVIIQ